MLEVSVTDSMYFYVAAPCGCGWTGMRHTEDVKIIVDRAMDHDHPSAEVCVGSSMDCGRTLPCPDHPSPEAIDRGGYNPAEVACDLSPTCVHEMRPIR